MSAQLAQEITIPRTVSELSDPTHLTICDPLQGTIINAGKDDAIKATLNSDLLIVVRGPVDKPLYVAQVSPDHGMQSRASKIIEALGDVFSDSRGVRVDCFGIGNCHHTMPLGDVINFKTFINTEFAENGFTRVFTHWPSPSNIQDVLVRGDNRSIEYVEYCPIG